MLLLLIIVLLLIVKKYTQPHTNAPSALAREPEQQSQTHPVSLHMCFCVSERERVCRGRGQAPCEGRGLMGGSKEGQGTMGAADWASMTNMLVILIIAYNAG